MSRRSRGLSASLFVLTIGENAALAQAPAPPPPLPDGYMRAPPVPVGLAPKMRVTETTRTCTTRFSVRETRS